MNTLLDLAQLSPFSNYLFSFIASGQISATEPMWLGIILFISTLLFWFAFALPMVSIVGFVDRKMGADVQMRLGPNRSGPRGIFQPFADFLRTLTKEEVLRSSSLFSHLFRYLGPPMSVFLSLCAFGMVPLAKDWVLSSPKGGALIIGVILVANRVLRIWVGQTSQTPWSVVSGLRTLISLSGFAPVLFFCMLVPILFAGSMEMNSIVQSQGGLPWQWNAVRSLAGFLGFVGFSGAVFLWLGRSPADFNDWAGNLANDYAANYSGPLGGCLRFGQVLDLYLGCLLVVAFYLGGWEVPFSLEFFGRGASFVQWVFVQAKTCFLIFLVIWCRWSLPRMDQWQVLAFSWKFLLPAGIIGSVLGLFSIFFI